MRHERLRFAKAALRRLDEQQRNEVFRRIEWVLGNAAQARRVVRSTPPGKSWFATYGLDREFVHTFAGHARQRGDHPLGAVWRELTGVAFAMRRPANEK